MDRTNKNIFTSSLTGLDAWLNMSPLQNPTSPLRDITHSYRTNPSPSNDLELHFQYPLLESQPAGLPSANTHLRAPTSLTGLTSQVRRDSLISGSQETTLSFTPSPARLTQWSDASSGPSRNTNAFSDSPYQSQSSIVDDPPLTALFALDDNPSLSQPLDDVSPIVRGSQQLSDIANQVHANALLDSENAPFLERLLSSAGESFQTGTNSLEPNVPTLSSPCKISTSRASRSNEQNENVDRTGTIKKTPLRQDSRTDAYPRSGLLSPLSPLPSTPSASSADSSPSGVDTVKALKRRRTLDTTIDPRRKRPRGQWKEEKLHVPGGKDTENVSSSAAGMPSAPSTSAQTLSADPIRTTRTFPPSIEISADFPLLYRRFPVSSWYRPPGVESPSPFPPPRAPGGIYNHPRGPLDLYTPRFVKGRGKDKVGLCPICVERPSRGGEGKKVWLPMKVSAFK
ncbi:hypothetical protein CC2G_010747 [Coprinopsis cinerea AmutBmut pab1-1]|nr:hypothetical protein CC2G_010747 [Coprinopsis cinerea AmutBmut pab1-1]